MLEEPSDADVARPASQSLFTYCPIDESIRDCNKFGDQSGNPQIGWDLDRPLAGEIQVRGWGPQGFACKIVNCTILQYGEIQAGAIGEFARFRLDYGIDGMRNGDGTYSRLWGERCFTSPLMHESYGRQIQTWWTPRGKSVDCWPNRPNATVNTW